MSKGKNQDFVFRALQNAGRPMTAYALLDQLRSKGIKAPLQIYRALEKLLAEGRIHRLDSINAYLVCDRPDCHASGAVAFAICDRCGQVEEFEDDTLRRRLSRRLSDTGFKARSSTIELHGDCASCDPR